MSSLKIGITGGIGSGKTTVCKIFEILHVPVYYADDKAKELMSANSELKTNIIAAFGDETYTPEGVLNREFLSKQVFNDAEKLNLLNSLVHPIVIADAEKWATENSDKPYTLKEAALLYESGSYKALDKIIVVTAPLETRIQRTMQRGQTGRESVLARMSRQMPVEEKAKKAHYIIFNDGHKALIPQVLTIHEQLLKLPKPL